MKMSESVRLSDGNVNSKTCPQSGFTLDANEPVMIPNDPVGHRKAEARRDPHGFRREEWLEDLAEYFFLHAWPFILHRNLDPFRFGKAHASWGRFFRRPETDSNLSAVGHGLDGIDDEIRKHLLHLPGIDECSVWPGTGLHVDRNLLLLRERSEHGRGLPGELA